MNASHVIAAILGFIGLTFLACFGLYCGESSIEKQCLNQKSFTVNGTTYACVRTAPEIKP